MERATTQLRNLLAKPGIIMAPGAYDCLTARIIENAGFPAVYMTGAGTSVATLGYPDLALATMGEMVGNAADIASTVNVPVIADADTGYGGILNIQRTIRQYQRAGVAGVHIEDQEFPKRCGHLDNKRVIGIDEMVGKIRAAVDARTDGDFVIIVRTDALAVTGWDDTMRRCEAFTKAGADVLFVEAIRSPEEAERVVASVELPLLYNYVETGKSPLFTAQELEQLGFKIVIYPASALLTVGKVVADLMEELKNKGSTAHLVDNMVTLQDCFELMGLSEDAGHRRELFSRGNAGPAMNEELRQFIKESLERGQTREAIRNVLLEAGWQEREVNTGNLSAFADVDFPVAVPRPRPYLHAREAFLYLVSFIALYVFAFSLGAVFFGLIDYHFSSSIYRYDPGPSAAQTTALAAVIVAFPLYLFLMRRLATAVAADPERRQSLIRRWLTYLTLVVGAAIILGDVIALLSRLLAGDPTTGFILKVAGHPAYHRPYFRILPVGHAPSGGRSNRIYGPSGAGAAGPGNRGGSGCSSCPGLLRVPGWHTGPTAGRAAGRAARRRLAKHIAQHGYVP